MLSPGFFDTVRPAKPTPGTIASLWENPSERNKIPPEGRELASDGLMPEWVAGDQIPMPDVQDRELYNPDSHIAYWLSGLSDYLNMVKRANLPLLQPKTILDFGGASGRVARHVVNLQKNISQLYVADINVNHVNFINFHFPKNTLGIKLSSLPHLPFADQSMDLIYGYSVFTHIDVYELTWLKELERVLRSGGCLYLTIHDENSWKVLPKFGLFNTLRNNAGFREIFKKSQDMPNDRLVFAYNTDSHDYNCNVFHSHRYIHSAWGKILDVVEIIPHGHSYQAVVVMRKR